MRPSPRSGCNGAAGRAYHAPSRFQHRGPSGPHGVIEINAQPDRLDLDDAACKMAKEMGVELAVSTDAHAPRDLGFMAFGIDQARRGWLEPDDVINTRPLAALRKLLRR